MNKSILFIMFAMLSFNLSAQNNTVTLFPETETGLVQYRNSMDVQLTKSEIYKGLKSWVALTFANPAEVLQMDDNTNGIMKVVFNSPFINGSILNASMLIEYKDNKYQYTISDIYTPTEPRFQHNQTAEGINRRIRERTDKGKTPMKYLTDYVSIADITMKSMEKSLNSKLTEHKF